MKLLKKALASRQLAGWTGQGVISATNFVMLLLVSHWGGMIELGYYSLGFSVVAMMMAAQDALVTRPYAIQLFKPPGGPGAHAYGTLVYGLALTGLMAVGLAGASLVIDLSGTDSRLAAVFLALAVAVPFVLTRDFARRFCFANLQMHRALAIDLATSALILGTVAAVAVSGLLGAGTALLCYGAAGGVASAAWFMTSRRSFTPVRGAVRDTARQSWALGKWLLLSQIALQLQGYAAQWLILVMAGAAATGIYSACLSVVNLSNPFLFGILNVLTPKYVRARNGGGDRALRHAVLRDALLILAVMAGFALALAMAGNLLLLRLFPAIDAAQSGTILTLLAAAAAIGSASAPATIALSTAERGPTIAALSFLSFLAGSAAVIALLPAHGLAGAAWGMLIVEALSTALRWAILLRVTSPAAAGAGTKAALEC